MLFSAFIFGLLGSFHCIGMCGPIAFLLPIDRKNKTNRFLQLLSYHFGRIFTYALLGFIIGVIGNGLNLFGLQQQLSIAIGLLMILIVVLPKKYFNRFNATKPIYGVVGKLKNAIGAQLKSKTPSTSFTLGFLNGLLPCGLVYMATFATLTTANAWQGSLYMVLFGIGTIPLMTMAIYFGNFITGKVKQRVLKVIPVFVVIIGVLFVLRGLGLGIPYISPSEMVTIEEVSNKHSCH